MIKFLINLVLKGGGDRCPPAGGGTPLAGGGTPLAGGGTPLAGAKIHI